MRLMCMCVCVCFFFGVLCNFIKHDRYSSYFDVEFHFILLLAIRSEDGIGMDFQYNDGEFFALSV